MNRKPKSTPKSRAYGKKVAQAVVDGLNKKFKTN